jgi:hypothetical protein
MVVGTTNGQPSLTFLDHLFTKTTGANTTTGKLPSRRNKQRQQNKISTDYQLIDFTNNIFNCFQVTSVAQIIMYSINQKREAIKVFFLFCDFFCSLSVFSVMG